MKNVLGLLMFIFLYTALQAQIIIDHNCTKLDSIPVEWIETAKANLHVAYGHTSHGEQLTGGLVGLIGFKGSLYGITPVSVEGGLDLRDKPFEGANDLGDPTPYAWEAATRVYLNANPEINVVMWAWCGQVSSATEQQIDDIYLAQMEGIEADYPGVNFVYMTGHLDGSGLEGDLHQRNEQIRNYCRVNNKILYDFADIETYNPDGVYYGDKYPNDNCDYDYENDNIMDGNWAIEWQNTHPGEWYNCESAHSQPLNANLKAYATWWLWARIAGWDGSEGISSIKKKGLVTADKFSLGQNYPNPFNPATIINYTIPVSNHVNLSVYNLLGQKVATLVDGIKAAGRHQAIWETTGFPSGVYLYSIEVDNYQDCKKMILIK